MNATSNGALSLRPPYPPQTLREYALLADGERGALIGPHGDIAWMCAPRWDSPALFSTLLGGNGSYAVSPADRHVWGGYYEQGSLIWRNRWTTNTGIIECREALAFPATRTGRYCCGGSPPWTPMRICRSCSIPATGTAKNRPAPAAAPTTPGPQPPPDCGFGSVDRTQFAGHRRDCCGFPSTGD